MLHYFPTNGNVKYAAVSNGVRATGNVLSFRRKNPHSMASNVKPSFRRNLSGSCSDINLHCADSITEVNCQHPLSETEIKLEHLY